MWSGGCLAACGCVRRPAGACGWLCRIRAEAIEGHQAVLDDLPARLGVCGSLGSATRAVARCGGCMPGSRKVRSLDLRQVKVRSSHHRRLRNFELSPYEASLLTRLGVSNDELKDIERGIRKKSLGAACSAK